MPKITTFISVTLDGFFAGPNGEIDWFKSLERDEDYEAFTHQNAKQQSVLIFGHTTYEMMKSYWPSADARKNDPDMAKVVNESPKVVFSRKLKHVPEEPPWKNIRVIHQIDRDEVLKLKKDLGLEMTILGSGSIVQQFANLGLIDEYALQVVPLVLGAGKPLFRDVKQRKLKLIEARSFKKGMVSLRYQPQK